MSTVIKAICGILISLILSQILDKQGKDFSLLLITLVCCLVLTAATVFMEPVIDFFAYLQEFQVFSYLNIAATEFFQ